MTEAYNRYLSHSKTGEPAAMFLAAVPDWQVGDTFFAGRPLTVANGLFVVEPVGDPLSE